MIAVSTSINFYFICALLCVAKPSRALIKEDTTCRGPELQRKMGSGIRFDETETYRDMFSNPFSKFSFFIRLFLTTNRFEIKNGQVFKQLLILSVRNFERLQLFKEFLSTGIHSLGKCA